MKIIKSIDKNNPKVYVVNEIQTKYKIEYREIYKLGRHKLMCGDSTLKQDVSKLVGDGKIDLIATDPPYGVDYASKNDFLNKAFKGSRLQLPIINDDIKDYFGWSKKWIEAVDMVLNDYNSIYIFGAGKTLLALWNACLEKGWTMNNSLVWEKNAHVLGRADYSFKHEFILYGWKKRHKYYGEYCTSLLKFDKYSRSKLHPTMKPIKLMGKLIKNSTKEGMNILDPFGGSGSTLIAAEQLNRNCFMMEIDPKYCSVIIERWENFTGLKAKKI